MRLPTRNQAQFGPTSANTAHIWSKPGRNLTKVGPISPTNVQVCSNPTKEPTPVQTWPKSGPIRPKSSKDGQIWAKCPRIRAKYDRLRPNSSAVGRNQTRFRLSQSCLKSGQMGTNLAVAASSVDQNFGAHVPKTWATLGRIDQVRDDFAHEIATKLRTISDVSATESARTKFARPS